MPKRSNDFQRLIYLIHRQLANETSVTESKFLHDKVTNVDREVDIAIETQIGGYPVIISIECQGRGRVASVEWVEQMVAKHQTLPTNKLILVSQSGFSETAYKKASILGIETMTIRQAIQADWNMLIKLPELILKRWKFVPTICQPILKQPDDQISALELDFEQQLYDEEGNELFTIEEVIAIYMDRYSEEIAINLKEDNRTVVGFSTEISMLEGTYFLDESNTEREINGLLLIVECSSESELVLLQNGSFGPAQIAFGKTHTINPESLVSIVEHEDGPNTGAIMLTANNEHEAQIINMRKVDFLKEEGDAKVHLPKNP